MLDKDILNIIGRDKYLFEEDYLYSIDHIDKIVASSSILIIGGAGSIGSAVSHELFKKNPLKLHIIDISENYLAELVRNLRCSIGYIKGDFKTFTLNYASINFDEFYSVYGPYDYVLNFAALKHVRSERDQFTLKNMIETNISFVIDNYKSLTKKEIKKYFTVSSDKAANPHNIMGASKKIMENILVNNNSSLPITFARFANVAFSRGSLLESFINRINYMQPLALPRDIQRYFITPYEASVLCILSTIFGNSNEIFIPKNLSYFKPLNFIHILSNYLNLLGYEIHEVQSEDEARSNADKYIKKKKWPCYFFKSDTTGEKNLEEFFTADERMIENQYREIMIIKLDRNKQDLTNFLNDYFSSKNIANNFDKDELISVLKKIIPGFEHIELNKNLDEKM